MREVLRLDDKVGSAVVSGTADRWFASLRVRWSPILPIRENRNGANSTEHRGQSSMLLDAPDRSPSAWHGGAINSLCVRAAVIAAPGGGGSLAQWRPLAPETNKADR
jgi:hypothetical protein